MSWFEALQAAAQSASVSLRKRGWDTRFGGPDESDSRIKIPQPARSEFLENRALGDWAEDQLARALRECGLQACHYGATDDIQSDEAGFAEFFRAQMHDLRRWGKRPDLIVVSSEREMPHSIAQLPHEERDAFVRHAFASIEIRSSRYKALQYMRLKAQRKAAKNKYVGQLAPNFTVKVEDLVILYRWVERHRVPQAYVQVFLDSAFGINVLSIFQLIAEWPKGLTLTKPKKSQGKPTIFVPITWGEHIGEMVEQPVFEADTRETPLGQVNAYVVPKGGKLRLERDRVMRVLDGEVGREG